MNPARRSLALSLLLMSVGAIAAIALGASADRGPGITYTGTIPEWPRQRSATPVPTAPSLPTPETFTMPPQPVTGGSGLVGNTLTVLLLLTVLAAAVWVALRMRALSRPAAETADAADPADDELTAEQARAAFEDARTHLSTVADAQDAVIAAWLSLERAIAGAGVQRGAAQTTVEYVVAVLGRLDLDRPALDRLAHLSRWALFDIAPLPDSARDEALALLDTLTAQLDPQQGTAR